MAFCEETRTYEVRPQNFWMQRGRRTLGDPLLVLVLKRRSFCDERRGRRECEAFISRSQLAGETPCLRWLSLLWSGKGAQHSDVIREFCRKTRTHEVERLQFWKQRRGASTSCFSILEMLKRRVKKKIGTREGEAFIRCSRWARESSCAL